MDIRKLFGTFPGAIFAIFNRYLKTCEGPHPVDI